MEILSLGRENEPTPFESRVSVLNNALAMLFNVAMLSTHICLCESLLDMAVQTTSLVFHAYNYIQTQGRFNTDAVHNLYRIIIITNCVAGGVRVEENESGNQTYISFIPGQCVNHSST